MSFAETVLANEGEVLEELGLSATTARLDRIASAISSRVERFLGFTLARKVFTEEDPDQLQGGGGPWLRLSRRPIESVDLVLINETEDEEWTRSDDSDQKGQLYRYCGWPRQVSRELLSGLAGQDRAFNIAVVYTGGWWLPNTGSTKPETAIDLPAEIQQVVVEEIVSTYENPNRNIVEETTPGGWKRKYVTSKERDSEAWALSKSSINALRGLKTKWFGHV